MIYTLIDAELKFGQDIFWIQKNYRVNVFKSF